jgi:hypothetical protein
MRYLTEGAATTRLASNLDDACESRRCSVELSATECAQTGAHKLLKYHVGGDGGGTQVGNCGTVLIV